MLSLLQCLNVYCTLNAPDYIYIFILYYFVYILCVQIYVSGLAILDLISAATFMPSDLMNTLHTTFPFDPTMYCRFTSFASFSLGLASGIVLIVIAISRYLRITGIDSAYNTNNKALGRSLGHSILRKITSVRAAKVACVVAFCVSVPPCFPSVFLYKNIVSSDCIGQNLSHHNYALFCEIDYSYTGSNLLWAFSGIFLFSIVFITITLIVLYTKAGFTVWKAAKGGQRRDSKRCSSPPFSKQSSRCEESYSAEGKSESSEVSVSYFRCDSMAASEGTESVVLENSYFPPLSYSGREISSSTSNLGTPEGRSPSFIGRRPSTSSFQFSKRGNKAIKTTLVFFCVTAIFIISYLPILVIFLLRAYDGDQWIKKKSLQIQIVIEVLKHSYLLSNAFNPVIYGLLNPHFRSSLWKVMLCRREIL